MKKQLLQHYLAQTAARFPDKTAVAAGRHSLTYRELAEKSGSLACQIRSLHLAPHEPVGIYLDKSVEAIAAVFAVLKAGCVYIPLDAHYSPASRVLQILKAGGLRCLVSDSAHVGALEEAMAGNPDSRLTDICAVMTDAFISSRGGASPAAREQDVHGLIQRIPFRQELPPIPFSAPEGCDTDLAYVLYTSGSTGIPKGVMISHLNAKTFIEWALSTFQPAETDHFANIAPLHFDLSVFDIYVSIACGATVHLAPAGAGSNPRALLSWIRESRITFFYSVPSVWMSIMHYAGLKQGDLPDLTHLLFAGEVFPPQQLKTLMEILPHTAFYNLYGPTETNVCTYYHVKTPAAVSDKAVPIGKACTGTEVVVVKENGGEAAVNEIGELLVRGTIVTSGYYRNPALTTTAFVKHSSPGHDSALFYKTGDLVRLTSSGDFEYLGRKDLMVKLAGFRIELPEIEQALLRHGAAREAVVVPVFNADGSNVLSLAAFVALKEGCKTGIVEIKGFLAAQLPRYMVPENILFTAELPRNGNGKADRRKLMEMAQTGGYYDN